MSLLKNCGVAIMLLLLAVSASAQIPGGRWGAPGAAQNLLDAVKEDARLADSLYTVIVTDGDGGGQFRVGTSINITAKDSTGYRFKEWTVTPNNAGVFGNQYDKTTMFIISRDALTTTTITILASFAQLHEVTVQNGTIVNDTTGGFFAAGDRVTIAANDSTDYRFSAWSVVSGAVNINTARDTTSFTMPNNPVTISGAYVQTYLLTVVDGFVHGTTANTGRFAENDRVRIIDDSPGGHRFVKWEPDENNSGVNFLTLSGGGAQFFMPGREITVTATFERLSLFTVTMTRGDTITNPNPAGTAFESEFAAGDTVRIKDRADRDSVFERWEFDPDNITTLHNAAFIMPPYGVNVWAMLRHKDEDELNIHHHTRTVNHRGDSAVGGGWIDGPVSARTNESVTLTAFPYEHHKFWEWKITGNNGESDTSDNSVTFIMPRNGDVIATAIFQPTHYRVTIKTDNSGTISVNGGNGKYDGTETILANSTVTFTARPDPGSNYTVSEWILDSVVSDIKDSTLELTIKSNTEVEVRFAENRYATISTAAELREFADSVNAGKTFRGKNFTDNTTRDTVILTTDINLDSATPWTPIGKLGEKDHPFRGTFDGNGHVISGLKITTPVGDDYAHGVGLFGVVFGGTVKNVGVDVEINVQQGNVGGIAGRVDSGTVVNCYSTGPIKGKNNVGGVVGYLVSGGTVTDSYSTCTVTSSGIHVGGVVGQVHGRVCNIIRCYSTGNVTGSTNVGGVAGLVKNQSSVKYSFSTGEITTTNNLGERVAGGIVGTFHDGTSISNCAALNPKISGSVPDSTMGRVFGSQYNNELAGASNNIAYSGMMVANSSITSGSHNDKNGRNANLDSLKVILNQFSSDSGWTRADSCNSFPVLKKNPNSNHVQTVAWPSYLDGIVDCSTTWPDPPSVVNEAPSALSQTASVVAPPVAAVVSMGKVSVGPNPASRSVGEVGIYVGADGDPPVANPPASAQFIIYDAVGNIVWRTNIRGDNINANANTNVGATVPGRPLAVWDLRDRRGRPVSPGTYLLRGIVVMVDGRRERVSVVFGVR